MKTRVPLQLFVVALALALVVGCSRGRSDSDLASDVRNKVLADPNVSSRQIEVHSENGVVTLSGAVESEMERLAAGNSAAQVQGVRTVVNNLTVAEQAELRFDDPTPPRALARQAPRAAQPAPRQAPPRAEVFDDPPAPRQAAPVQPAAATRVTIPEGTTLSVRLIGALDSEKNKTGDTFTATLDVPLRLNGEIVVPAHTDVEGRIIDAKDAGHFSGRSELVLQLTRLVVDGRSYELTTNQWSREGASQGKRTAATVGGGAAAGAVLGGIIGGGKGAAIGAAAGAGAGPGVQAATGGKPIRLPAETVLGFQLEQPLTVTPARTTERRQLPVN
jgi:hypothetical protein